MRFPRLLAALSVVTLMLASTALHAQGRRSDLSSLFLRDLPAPLFTLSPVAPGAAFIAINASAFDRLDMRALDEIAIDRFPTGDGRSVKLSLERLELLAPTAITVAGTSAGDVPFEPEKHLVASGRVEGMEGSYVYLAIFRTYCVGYIDIPSPEGIVRHMIAPDDASGAAPATMIVYDTRRLAIADRPHNECGAENLPGYQARVDEVFRRVGAGDFKANGKGRSVASLPMLAAQIALDCDYRYYQAHNSSLSQSANYALVVLGASSAIYRRDVNVMLQIPYLRVWTTVGPYVGPNIGDLLGQIRDHWNSTHGSVRRSTTLMLSHNVGGGLAWVGVLCGDFGYAVAGLGNDVNYPADGYLWDVDVASHELGHNFGSAHTHNCSWAPPIDSCVAPEGDCGRETNPHTGSIMSYCHLNAGTALHFHPRVATLIRRNFELSSCVGPVEGRLANDVAVVDIVRPANGGKITKGVTFTPSAIVRNIGTTTQTNLPVAIAFTPATTGVPIYSNTQTVPTLAPGASVTVTFAPTSLDAIGVYEANVSVTLANDSMQINNAMARPFEVANAASPATMAVKAPNGGESYQAGRAVQIQWSASGTTAITIQFSSDNGRTWQVVRLNQGAAIGTMSWTVPAIATTEGRIRINDLNDASASDMSDGPFTITVGKDVQALDFVAPIPAASSATPVAPQVEIRNNGSEIAKNIVVRLRMLWRGDGTEVYNDTVTVAELGPGAVQTVSFPATRLLPEGTHVMIARVTLSGDEQPSNDSIGRTCDFQGIAPPLGVRAYPMSRAVLLSWSRSTSEKVTGYQIYRGESPENLAPLATVRPTVLAYADEPVQDNVTYYYAVSTMVDSKRSIPSRIVSAEPATAIAGFKLGAPDLLVPEAGAGDVPVPTGLLWQTLEGGEIYQVQVANNASMSDVVANQFTEEPRISFPSRFGGAYYWRVRAFNYSSVGAWSAVRSFTAGDSCGAQALALDGEGAKMTAPTFLWSDTAVTVEFWNYVRSSDVKNSSAFAVGTEVNGDRFQAHAPWSDRTLYWDYGDIGTTGRISASYSAYLDKWTHVALVSDGKTFKGIYLDGVLVASGNEASFPTSRTNLVVGCFINNDYHKGLIDEFRIWRRVRTQEEIERDMRKRITPPQTGLAGYWRFDEQSGLAVPDVSGSGANGTLTADTLWRASGAPINCDPSTPIATPVPSAPADGTTFTIQFSPELSWSVVRGASVYQLQLATVPGFESVERDVPNVTDDSYSAIGLRPATRYYWRVRTMSGRGAGGWSRVSSFTTAANCPVSALAFNDEASVLRADSFALAGRAVTVEFWNYVDSNGVRNSSAFSVGTSDVDANRMQSHAPWGDRTLYWDYGNTGPSGRLTAGYAPYLSRWTHVALVSNGYDYKAIYLNGDLVASSTTAARPSDLTRLVVGGILGRWYHNGMIDEFRVWNTPRTREAIRRDMYRKLAPPRSGLVGYWSMDEGKGTSARDSSGFAHDGSLAADSNWRQSDAPVVPLPEPISGPAITRPLGTGNVYSVALDAGNVYRWNVIGGKITSGAGTASITVDWFDTTRGVVALTVERAAGCADSTFMPVTLSAGTGVDEILDGLSFTTAPDPFSTVTELRYTLPRREHVSLAIYSIDGALVARMVDGAEDAGEHVVRFDGAGLSSGVYLCRFGVGGEYLLVKALHLVR